jgi:hypothetical protein
MEFHWGQNGSAGSEHSIAGRRFPVEVRAFLVPQQGTKREKKTSLISPDLHILSRDEPLLQLAQAYSCWNDHRGDMSDAYHGGTLRCYVHIMEQGLCYRVNTLAAYIEANRLVRHTLCCGPSGVCGFVSFVMRVHFCVFIVLFYFFSYFTRFFSLLCYPSLFFLFFFFFFLFVLPVLPVFAP